MLARSAGRQQRRHHHRGLQLDIAAQVGRGELGVHLLGVGHQADFKVVGAREGSRVRRGDRNVACPGVRGAPRPGSVSMNFLRFGLLA